MLTSREKQLVDLAVETAINKVKNDPVLLKEWLNDINTVKKLNKLVLQEMRCQGVEWTIKLKIKPRSILYSDRWLSTMEEGEVKVGLLYC